MKPFSDFLDTVDDSDYSDYIEKIVEHVNTTEPTHDNAMLSITGQQVLYYLEKYHEWLCNQGLVIVHNKKP